MRTILIVKSISRLKRISCVFTAATLLASASRAQAPEQPTRLTFEVASIRLTPHDAVRSGGVHPLPGGQGYTSQGMPVKELIALMYKIPVAQIEGGPSWMDNEDFDIEAKADHSYNIDDLHTMFQNLLADRFNLKFHKVVREGNVFALTVDKDGSKMTVNPHQEPSNIPMQFTGVGNIRAVAVDMKYFSWFISQFPQLNSRPILNLTGLTGYYDFTLVFTQDLPGDFPQDRVPPGFLDRPNLFVALKEQLGLKLTAQKGPVEYYVIDHIEKPTEN